MEVLLQEKKAFVCYVFDKAMKTRKLWSNICIQIAIIILKE